jgi:SHS2 domain-containing protein
VTYRFLPHTADLRVAIEAPTFAALLADLVAVVRELTAGDRPVAERAAREVAVEADEPADLLFRFTREVLGAFQLERLVPARVAIKVLRLPPEGSALRATLHGEPFHPARHEAQPEIKAVTRHGLVVDGSSGVWRAELLFDV